MPSIAGMDVRKLITPGRIAIGIIILGGVIITLRRFAFGLGATTNLSDQVPWGLWISFDVISGVALAAGGFTMALLVHIAGDHTYRGLVRPAILTAFLGYLLVIVGLLFDIGKPWNIWHAIIYWNHHSAMFEVAWCVMLYTTVLLLEFLPMVLERFGLHAPMRIIRAIQIPLFITGIVLSTLHQSSLGSLFLLTPGKLHPLWYTRYLPLLFFFSAVTVGFAMVMLESFLSSKFLRRGLELRLLARLGRYLAFADIFYLILRIQDLTRRGVWGEAFTGSTESIFFLAEMALFTVPLFILFSSRLRRQRTPLFLASLMIVIGLVLNRLNISLVGMLRSTGGSYLPNWQEIWLSVFLVLCAALVFGLAARFLPVFSAEGPRDAGAGAKRSTDGASQAAPA
ncbi:MAG: Ni/Fe-hydrogenase cytochrome b subunit [Candidatus Eisenbacteria sp.]|nr:Ni/Fe-hydrogenase cytochrome b subunit [Candidatus Eisenbacteria bacterium]